MIYSDEEKKIVETVNTNINKIVKDFLDEEFYAYKIEGKDSFEFKIYANYYDFLSMDDLDEICESESPKGCFTDKVNNAWQNAIYEYVDEIYSELKEYVIKKYCNKFKNGILIDNYFTENDAPVNSLHNHIRFVLDYDHYSRQEVHARITLNTGDANYDFTLNTIFPHYNGRIEEGADDKASIVWLAKQQGYTKEQFLAAMAMGDKRDPKGFLESCQVELANCSSSMNALTILFTATVKELIEINTAIKNKEKKILVIGKDCDIGLFDTWNGGGSLLEIQLDKNVEVPFDMIYRIGPDEPKSKWYYSANSVYGLTSECFRGTIKSIKEDK